MTKKAAILTQPLGANFGGIIQNFALQEVLKDLGFNPITIDRRKGINYVSVVKRILYRWFNNSKQRTIPVKILKNRIYKHSYTFIRSYINVSKLIQSDRELKRFVDFEKFDAFIVGSDQTWRPMYSPNIYNYYLDFLEDKLSNRKCIAYASSFGTDVWEYTAQQTEVIKNLVNKFNAISVREDTGVKLCKDYLNVEVEHVLDPTLLLNATDYIKKLSLIQNLTGKNKLYTYVLDNTKEKLDFIERCSSDLGLHISNNQAKKKVHEFKDGDCLDDYIVPSLENWLAGFKNAEFVITDSFHGTVFSIIFQKPFISIVNEDRGASRFYSLLSKLGLENRLVKEVGKFDYNLLSQKINYVKVHQQLESLKNESFEFLKENLTYPSK